MEEKEGDKFRKDKKGSDEEKGKEWKNKDDKVYRRGRKGEMEEEEWKVLEDERKYKMEENKGNKCRISRDEGIRQEKETIENNGREGRNSCRELKGGRKWKRRENW